MTPYEKLKSIPDAKTYLKPGLSFAILDEVAYRISDNAAADALQPRRKLFTTIYEQAETGLRIRNYRLILELENTATNGGHSNVIRHRYCPEGEQKTHHRSQRSNTVSAVSTWSLTAITRPSCHWTMLTA